MNKKKETSNIVIYICMVILILMIAIPPILRVMVPKDEQEQANPKEENSIVLVNCTKEGEDGTYRVSNRTRYVNHNPSSVTITYTKIAPENTTIEENNTPVEEAGDNTTTSPDNSAASQTQFESSDPDILSFRQLIDAAITENEDSFSVVLNQKTLTSNSAISTLKNYFQSMEEQTAYYQNLNYTCSQIES